MLIGGVDLSPEHQRVLTVMLELFSRLYEREPCKCPNARCEQSGTWNRADETKRVDAPGGSMAVLDEKGARGGSQTDRTKGHTVWGKLIRRFAMRMSVVRGFQGLVEERRISTLREVLQLWESG